VRLPPLLSLLLALIVTSGVPSSAANAEPDRGWFKLKAETVKAIARTNELELTNLNRALSRLRLRGN